MKLQRPLELRSTKNLLKSKTKSFNRIHFSSKSIKHNTPDDIFQELHEEFHFTQDPARPPKIGPGLQNALAEPWIGRIFVNPPYRRKLIERWIARGINQYRVKNASLIVFLLPLRMSKWMKMLLQEGAELRYCQHRLKFGDAADVAPFDSVVAILNSTVY